MITQELDLNMVPGTVPPVINVSQFDTGARTFVFTLYNGATLFNGSVASCRIEGIKPDNKGFSYNASYSNGKVTADCTEQMTAVVGNVLCEIRLLEDNQKTLGTLNFILCVERSPLNADVDISETELPPIIDLARQHERAAAQSASEAASSASKAATSATKAANSAAQAESIRVDLLNHLNQIDTNTSNISALRTDVDKHTTDISGLRTDVNKNADDISALRTDVDKNADDISSLRTDVDFNDLRITGLRTDVNGLRTDVDKHTTDISKLRTDVNTNTKGLSDLTKAVQKADDKLDKDIAQLRSDLDTNDYKTERIYQNVFKDGPGKLYVKQGFLKVLQGVLAINKGKISVISELREDVDKNISDINKNATDISALENKHDADVAKLENSITDNVNILNTEIDKKLNRPEDNPCGNLDQLLASVGNGTNANKWVNLDDLLRASPLIKHIIDMLDSTQGILTVSQGNLTVTQGQIHLRILN